MDAYKTWIFDCDGVLLDSNHIKSEAFYEVALSYGKDNADTFLKYHRDFGGVSRYEKFNYFFKCILRKTDYSDELCTALERYGTLVKQKLVSSRETTGARKFLEKLPEKSMKYVISGGNQDEVRDVFRVKGLERYFTGIFGSPEDKITIIHDKLKSKDIQLPAIFIGDSRYDYEVAVENNFAFVFMSQYSEFKEWKKFFSDKKDVMIIKNLSSLI